MEIVQQYMVVLNQPIVGPVTFLIFSVVVYTQGHQWYAYYEAIMCDSSTLFHIRDVRMDRSCPNNLCDFKYNSRKKPFKCPDCEAYIGTV